VPSAGTFPRQQPQSLSGFRASSGGFSPSPGSYQEQLLFIANENAKQSPPAATSPFGTQFGGGSSQFAVSFSLAPNSNSIISLQHFLVRRRGRSSSSALGN